jgi:aminopeptidase N
VASNLTRQHAAARARLLRIHAYQIELDLHAGSTSFESRTTVRFSCTDPGAETFIDLTAERVSQLTLNGTAIPLSAFDGDRIALPGLASENELTVRAQCSYSRTGEGLHWFTDPADDNVYLYSNLETFHAHKMYACFDQPDLKSTFEFTVRCPADWQVVSTTAPDLADHPTTRPGISSWHFPPTPPISTYITMIAAGPYHVVRSEHDGIPLGLYCRQSLASYLDAAELFEITSQGFDFFQAAFGLRYQFGKFDQLFVPEFNAGAMENAGAVTFVEYYLFRSRVTQARREERADTILHEMAHMWFGDLVTMTWWDDLWLNESFASWAALMALTEATRFRDAWTTFSQDLKAWAYRQDQLPSTHPIVADIDDVESVEVYFDGITYAKGAAVLRQLVAFVGLDGFLAGLRSYFAAHAWGNATLADLMDALERASGRPLADWSKAWLETAGVNTLRPVFQTGPEGSFTEFAVLQQAADSHPALRPHRIAIGLYDTGPQGLRRRKRVELDVTGERTEVPELVGERLPDLVLVNDDDLTFAKIRLDEHSLRTAVRSIGEFTEPLPAALCLAAAWDMCRDAELPARDYLTLALAAAAHLSEVAVLQTVLFQATGAVRRFADPGWRQTGLDELARSLRELLRSAAPGSDRQLSFAQAFASVASQPADLDLLADLLSGATSIDGLAIDTDLRWQLLGRLVNRGVAGPAEIEAEHERDRTDSGERYAQLCQALIPDPAAKEAAWAAITSGTLTNATFKAVVNGFQAADQDDLLAPYAARFFDVVADKWQAWGPDQAQFFVERAYPMTLISQQAIDAAATYLATADPPPPLRRLLSEGRDDVARALRCREADAAAG